MIAAFVFALVTIATPPTPTQYVTDNANALSSSKREALESELRSFEAKSGDQVIVWTGDTTGDTPLEEWTAQAGHLWKIGHKNKDNGAILFLFMHDRKVRIEVGYGLEPKLTDAQSAGIINGKILPAMHAGDVDGAVQGGVDGMLAALDPTFSPTNTGENSSTPATDDTSDDTGEGIAALVVGLIFLLLILAVVVTIMRRGKKHGDWLDLFLMSSAGGASNWSSHGGFGGFGGGGGFSAGGGDFGGGGASGGW